MYFLNQNSTINIDLEAKISDLNLEMIKVWNSLNPLVWVIQNPKY